MFEKSRILRRNHGVSETFWNVLDRLEKAPLDEELPDHLSVIGIDSCDQTRLIVLQRF